MTKIYEALERLEHHNGNRTEQNKSGATKQTDSQNLKKYEVLHPVTVRGNRGKQPGNIRGIYSGMLFRIKNALQDKGPCKIIQVVGSRPGEGVSTLVRELAETAVRDFGSNTLLIGMDFMGDTQFSHFAGPEVRALPQGRKVSGESQRIIEEGEKLHLTSLTDNEAARMASKKNGGSFSALDSFRNSYDMIFIDSPPLQHNQANPLFPLADAVVLVVEAEKTKHQVVRRSKESIERQGGNLIGIVLNKKQFHVPDWLYKKI